ncbi:MAG: protoporphyrinogen oxidase [Thermodesulfobacteriota bacterium]
MKKVVIIGGGISGLSTAYSLEKLLEQSGDELTYTLFEKRTRLGGNIVTEKEKGFVVEGGPDCFISEKPWALALCKELGLKDEIICTNDERRKTFVLWKGKLHELPEGVILMVPTKMVPILWSTLISFPGKIRMGMEYFIPKRKSNEDESLGSFVRRRLGKEALTKIAEPLIAGIHAGDPETMSIKSSFPRFVDLEQNYGSLIKGMLARMVEAKKRKKKSTGEKMTMFMTLKGGVETLTNTIASCLPVGSTVQGKEITGISRSNVNGGNPSYAISFAGDDNTVKADAVIIAAPAHVAAKLLENLDPSLAGQLADIPYASTATVSVAYKKEDVSHPLNGFGFVIPKVENRQIMAATWTSVKFSYRAPEDAVLIRCFVGGSMNEELVSLSDEEMVKMVREELKDIMGIDAKPTLSKVFRFHKSMPQYTIGHEERVARIEQVVDEHEGLFLTGSAYRGIGISDCVHNGEITAKKVFDYLTK